MITWSHRSATLASIVVLISLTVHPPSGADTRTSAGRLSATADAATADRANEAHPRISSELTAALGLGSGIGLRPTASTGDGFLRRGNLIAVTIRTSDASATVRALEALGRRPANRSPHVIEVYLSAGDVTSLEAEPSVSFMQAIVPPQGKEVIGEGRAAHNATNWINGGVTGAGVKVGVLDYFYHGITNLVGTEVPANIIGRCYTDVGVFTNNLNDCTDPVTANHGTAVAESILDIAPGVQLFIADPSATLDFRSSIDWMIAQGVSVIVFAQAYPWDGPGDGTSPFANSPLRSVDAAVAGGAVVVIAAGNEHRKSWFGPWRDNNGNTYHEFSASPVDELNRVSLVNGHLVQVQARWQDSWTGASSDLAIEILDPVSGNILASSNNQQSGVPGQYPLEFVSFTAPRADAFPVRLRRIGGPLPAWVQIQTFNAGPTMQYNTDGGSMCNPAESANPGVLAVGAAPWDATSTIRDFSSLGPTPDGRIKPDIVGADGGMTASKGAFVGTSQAAPYVGGLAALVKGAFPSYSPAQVAGYLKTFAQPRGGAVPNNTWGYGFAYLRDLEVELPPAAPLNLVATVNGNNVSLTWQPPTAGTVTGYVVEAGSAPGIANLASFPIGNTLSFATGAANGSYYVRVRAQSSVGPGAASNELLVQVGGGSVPGAPTNLQAALNGSNVSLSWSPPMAGGPPPGYRVEASLTPAGPVMAAFNTVTSTLFVPGVPPGRYYVRVRATNGAGASAPSNEVTVLVAGTAAPAAPFLSGGVVGSSVSLTWNHTGAASYVIHVGTGSGQSNVGTFPVGSVTGATASGVAPGVYFVRVMATGAGGASASNEVVLTVGG
ncbi:MAG: S8 family serine peptidase [Acidobacteria bacterium]|nr:S8 family serine peptidase [Acidobacteriota bacterium]